MKKETEEHVVVELFEEEGHIYEVGDVYPKQGSKKPTAKRLKTLSTKDNKYNKIFIKKVEEKE